MPSRSPSRRGKKGIRQPPGTLRIGDDGVVFDTTDPKHRRVWHLDDVRQFRVESSRRLVIETFRSRGWKGAGRSRTYEYATGTDIPDALVAFLLARVTRPVVTAVLPQRRTTPAPLAVAVHHEGTDTAGTLALYDDGLAFEADRDGFARYWRFSDLDAVLDRTDTGSMSLPLKATVNTSGPSCSR